jgi:HEAT repeat protein
MDLDNDKCQDDLRLHLQRMQTDELIQLTLTANDEIYSPGWDAIWVLHSRPTREVFDAAKTFCESDDPAKRMVGVNILAQLGPEPRPYLDETLEIFFKLIDTEQDSGVLNAVGIGLGHNWDEPRKVEPLLKLKNHPDADVRFGVALGLKSEEDPRAIQALIELSFDEDDDVRDWATFGLGSLTEADTPEIREALYQRVIDPDDDSDAPGEGLVGLAERHDPRAVDLTLKFLEAGNAGTLIFDAAEIIADPRLYSALVNCLNNPIYDDYHRSWIESAMAACKAQE